MGRPKESYGTEGMDGLWMAVPGMNPMGLRGWIGLSVAEERVGMLGTSQGVPGLSVTERRGVPGTSREVLLNSVGQGTVLGKGNGVGKCGHEWNRCVCHETVLPLLIGSTLHSGY